MGNTFCCSCSPSQEQNEIAASTMSEVRSMQDIDQLIDYIDQIISKIERRGQECILKPPTVVSLIDFGGNLIENLSKRFNLQVCKKCLLCALHRQTRTVVIDILKDAGIIPYLGIGLSVIANLLERRETASSNQSECLSLLRYMFTLAKHMKNLNVYLERNKLNDIVIFIVEGTLMCVRLMEPNNTLCRFFFAPLDADDLKNLKLDLLFKYEDLTLEVLTALSERQPKHLDPSQGEYPLNAVGIEEAQNKVKELLDLKDSAPRVVVIYGVGGIGKTTLAAAVFSSLDLTGYHYCRVDMDQDCKESNLTAMQEQILRDLSKEKKLELRNCTEGRERLLKALGKASKPIFLFIDNALRKTDLETLLPIEHISRLPKQSRIFLTTRNLNETDMFQDIQFHFYSVDSVSEPEAKRLLCHYALGNANGSFDPAANMDGLLQICGGIPLLLKLVGSTLRTELRRSDGDTVSACNEIIEYLREWERKGFEGGEERVRERVSDRMVDFVYRGLKEPSQEAFLDVASFFHDWERSEVADILGNTALLDLERAALITTSPSEKEWDWKMQRKVKMTKVKMHDIVRARGRRLSEGKRITDRESLSILVRDEQALRFKYDEYPCEEIMSTMFFNSGSRFVQVDGEGQLGEVEWIPEVGVQVGLVLTACALSEEVKEKVAASELQIMYVDVGVEGSNWMEERKKRISEMLVRLPQGSLAWTNPSCKTTLLFAYSICRFTKDAWLKDLRIDRWIVCTNVGRRKLSQPWGLPCGRDACDSRHLISTLLELKTLFFSPLEEAWDWMYYQHN